MLRTYPHPARSRGTPPTPMLACLLALSSATSSMPSRITTIAPGNFARVLPSRVQAAFALEAASYPADEAATLENLQLRAEVAGEYFWGVSEGGALEGFICGTLTCGDTLTEESMSAHDPAGQTLCIHSVVVAEERRRLGLGSAMLKARHMCSMRTAMLHAAHCMCEISARTGPLKRAPPVPSEQAYVKQVADHTPVCTILLMCKKPLIPFYSDAGFTLVGQSDVVHGLDPWFEMRCQV